MATRAPKSTPTQTIATPAEPNENPAAHAVAQVQETVETMMKVGQETAAKTYEQAMTATKEQVENANRQLFKGYDELLALGKGNIDALVESGTIAATGMEKIGRQVVAFAQSSLESGISTGKAMLSAKTLPEIVELQSAYATKSFENSLSESARLSEMSVKVANEALEPIGARVETVMKQIFKPIAA